MERRDFLGNVSESLLAVGINSTASSIQLSNGNAFPSGSDGFFVIVINAGLPGEEKVLASSRTGNVITVAQRGYDGTVANSHSSSSTVNHVLDAFTLKDMNRVTYDNLIVTWMGL